MAYLDKIKDLLAQIKKYNIQQIPREQNATTDALARLASSVVMDKILSDNGTQFDNQLFTDFCAKHDITKSFSTVSHPQENKQVKAVNKIFKDTLKKRLELAKQNWPETLPKVLWSYRTTNRTTTGDTPFALPYGYDAMLLVKMTPPSHRRTVYNQDHNHQLLAESLDQIEERRE
ncbi:uncharacterized protein LOC133779476 [Humulus lupulus]|uniref:uncharacterized protein LOC133779476 n=1 Tax=Humulus lupulus TaxID=3486 RepID=UPI002B4146FA|nr:uncharacterized protein LOC133779476 [Humulus lupulus]